MPTMITPSLHRPRAFACSQCGGGLVGFCGRLRIAKVVLLVHLGRFTEQRAKPFLLEMPVVGQHVRQALPPHKSASRCSPSSCTACRDAARKAPSHSRTLRDFVVGQFESIKDTISSTLHT